MAGVGVLVAGLAGCVVGEVGGVEGNVDNVSDAEIAQIASAYRDYPRINGRPYRSGLGAFDIDVYVSPDGAAAYAGIDPGRSGTGASLPPGAVIVRQVLGPDEATGKLTMMMKRSPGFNPACGDWWFGVTDLAGTVLDDDAGVRQAGALAACNSCHIPRAGDDFLFGVPAADRP